MAYASELEAAVQAARGAADVIRQYAGRVRAETVREKGMHDLVTEADEASQQHIIEQLQEAFPGYEVLAEEGAELSHHAERASGHRWIVDPIDGTTNFLHGVPPYSVSIALQRGAEIVVGVVLEVAHGELFTAVRGQGAYANGERIQVSETGQLENGLIATGFPYRSFEHIEAYLDVLRRLMPRAQGMRRRGSAAIDLAHVARGWFDGFFETGLKPWDVAAGILLVEEAGGRVTDYKDRSGPLFEQQILATNNHLHPALLNELSNMRDVRI